MCNHCWELGHNQIGLCTIKKFYVLFFRKACEHSNTLELLLLVQTSETLLIVTWEAREEANLGMRWTSPGPNLLKATVMCMFLSPTWFGWDPNSITCTSKKISGKWSTLEDIKMQIKSNYDSETTMGMAWIYVYPSHSWEIECTPIITRLGFRAAAH